MGLQGKMEGWLCLMRLNRFGLQYSRKRYFILEDNCLKSFKFIPTSPTEEPVRSAIIDSCIHVTDNGRETFHRKVLFIFTLYNTSDHNDQLKFGATSPEEASNWIHCLKDAALNTERSLNAPSRRKWQPFRLSVSKSIAHKSSMDMAAASFMHVDAMTFDVIAPSPWKIFVCQNGLRLFKEVKDKGSNGKQRDCSPAVMAVGVIEGTSEAIFRTFMCLGQSRLEWDFSFYRGCVVEHLDGHTDIVHIQLYNHWLPWGTKRRDLLLRRYWRREEDGTCVILYHSVIHSKCPPQNGYVRACIKSNKIVLNPLTQYTTSMKCSTEYQDLPTPRILVKIYFLYEISMFSHNILKSLSEIGHVIIYFRDFTFGVTIFIGIALWCYLIESPSFGTNLNEAQGFYVEIPCLGGKNNDLCSQDINPNSISLKRAKFHITNSCNLGIKLCISSPLLINKQQLDAPTHQLTLVDTPGTLCPREHQNNDVRGLTKT
ncbi:hypothetical protein R3W88_011716 [Solanum pinnatisectum]|uniref:Uncharacterized protein n=1 Tax=Solanum pinnatisectum TaxID=50273 RepID=A0AAV9L896_9SOLN|nr:hypothetical protein R3W88_011716 [Solanum pinnatisectum]